MKIKSTTKLITIIMLIFIILLSLTTIVKANPVNEYWEGVEKAASVINPDDFKPGELTASDTAVAFRSAGVIVGAIINVGLVISIVMFMVLGMKYMIGSVEEKAEYKKTLIPIVVGTLLLFTTGKIVSIIWSIMEEINI